MSAQTTAEITLPDLDGLKCHVAWREEPDPKNPDKLRKVPYDTSDKHPCRGPHTTWGVTRKAASDLAKRLLRGSTMGGLGIVLGTHFDGYVLLGIDLDGCRDPDFGTLTRWARKIVNRLPATYTEVSPSGTGIKLFMLCTVTDAQLILHRMGKKANGDPLQGRNFKIKAADGEKAPGIEAYRGERYFTVTGKIFPGSPDTLAIVSAEDFLWVVEKAGPDFLSSHGIKTDTRQKSGWCDESESGIGWRIAVEAARDGVSFEDYLDRLEDCDDVSRWREDTRQVERTWENALKKADKESDRIVAMFEDLGPNPDGLGPLERMNKDHAVVRNGGKTFIVHINGSKIDFGPVADLHVLYKNKQLTMNGRKRPVSEHWLEWPKRKQYENGVTFDPSEQIDSRTLNLWTGWAVRADIHASCKLLLNHLRHVVCDGDQDAYRYLLGWMAHLVQYPGEKPGVGLILKGLKGTGKSVVSDYLAAMIGMRHSPVVAETNQLTGKFNAHMADALLFRVEEGYWAGDRKAEGVLKNLVTSETLAIEKKGVDVGMVRSVMRVVITSNSDWIVPASFDERRWAVFSVNESRKGNAEYFKSLFAELNANGPAALLAFLQSYDLTGFNVRVAPETEGLLEQKLASLRDFDKWWLEVLRRGDLADDWETGEIRVGCDSIADDYNAHAKETQWRMDHMDGRDIGKALRKVCPDVDRKRDGKRSSRIWRYIIPALPECRRAFEKLAKSKIDWTGDNA